MSTQHAVLTLPQEVRRFGGGFFLSAADQAIVSGATFLASVCIGRYAGAEELSVYGLGMSIVFFAIGVQDSVISSSYVIHSRLLSDNERKRYAGAVVLQLLCMAAVVAIILTVVMCVAQTGWGSVRYAIAIPILCCLPPAMLLRQFARKFAFAEKRVGRALLVDAIITATQVLGLAALFSVGMLESLYAWALLVGACATGLTVWWLLFRSDFSFQSKDWLRNLELTFSQGKWLLGCRMVGLTHRHSAIWILGALAAPGSVGVFTACMSIVAVSNIVLFGLANFLEPQLAGAYSTGGAKAIRQIETRITIAFSIAMAGFPVLLYLFGGSLVALLYKGSAFQNQTHAITVLGVSLWAESFAMVRSQALKILHRADLNLRANITSAVISVTCGCVLTPFFGVVGAAYGILAGNIAASLLRHLAYEQAMKEAK